ncbi:MAG: hypothetical protein AVDCRST_MAG77-1145 [uncultured Chloroflexi bacterium]|uniref:Uncharacterized protein n=1 Tax=uncultured Chloroflexota bacterium TaxID=166587 RepID=A0A6J4HSP6_9CHLR|nr:MAG: hypothetical protein AVDCRST_MAG77-1145 [uncultured Chloroflexota bacterium]
MAADSTSCNVLQREIARGILRHTWLRGQGAPLVFLWVLGLATFTAVWPEPALAVTWSVLAAAFSVLTLRDQLHRPGPQRLVMRSFAARRFPTEAIVDAATRGVVERGVALFAEIAAKALEIHRSRGEDHDLDRAVADADGLVALQLQCARHAQELDRVLHVIDETATVQITVAAIPHARADAGGHDTRGAVAREVEGARELVDQIDLQLQELLLHLAQLDRRAGDLVQTTHTTQRAGETLERLRLVVMTRREASEEAIRTFAAHSAH